MIVGVGCNRLATWVPNAWFACCKGLRVLLMLLLTRLTTNQMTAIPARIRMIKRIDFEDLKGFLEDMS
jgi:hypothetical protein